LTEITGKVKLATEDKKFSGLTGEEIRDAEKLMIKSGEIPNHQ